MKETAPLGVPEAPALVAVKAVGWIGQYQALEIGMAARGERLTTARGRWHVYFLRCRDGSLYAGATNDLARRVARHAAGKGARYTRSRLPVALVFDEPARGRSAALRREAALKRLSRAAKLALVEAGAADEAPVARRRR